MHLIQYFVNLYVILIAITFTIEAIESKEILKQVKKYNNYEFGDHSVVRNSEVFPYVVAILRMNNYLSAGALIDEKWIITDANTLYKNREVMKTMRVRLGSINYKKGGELLPIKLFHIHPYFNDGKPLFDIALIELARSVRFTSKIFPVQLADTHQRVTAAHFTIISWSGSLEYLKEPNKGANSMEMIKRRRLLAVTHLHQTAPEDCEEELQELGINSTECVMCLDPGIKINPCLRDIGAPVILNGNLLGIVSSWKPDNCNEKLSGPTLATLISEDHVATWVHAITHGHTWEYEKNEEDYNQID